MVERRFTDRGCDTRPSRSFYNQELAYQLRYSDFESRISLFKDLIAVLIMVVITIL
jgi:hypothetical protein